MTQEHITDDGVRITVSTYSGQQVVSAELLREQGPDTRSAAERAEARREYEAKKISIAADKRRVWSVLAEQTGVLGAVLALHQPTDEVAGGELVDPGSDLAQCRGCDCTEYEPEPARFPCSTVALIAAELGVPFSDDTLTDW